MKNQAKKWLSKGFRFAYTIKADQTLQDAFNARFISTSEKAAKEEAKRKLLLNEKERSIKVYDLTEIAK